MLPKATAASIVNNCSTPSTISAADSPKSEPTDNQAPVSAGVAHPAASDTQPEVSRKTRLLAAVRSLFQDFSGYNLSQVEESADLLELGLDSLLLTQASQVLHRKFGVSITFRQLMEELSSLGAIAAHLDASMPPETVAEKSAARAAVSAVPASSIQVGNSQNAILEQILEQQRQLTNQVLQLMGRQPSEVAAPTLRIPPVLHQHPRNRSKNHTAPSSPSIVA